MVLRSLLFSEDVDTMPAPMKQVLMLVLKFPSMRAYLHSLAMQWPVRNELKYCGYCDMRNSSNIINDWELIKTGDGSGAPKFGYRVEKTKPSSSRLNAINLQSRQSFNAKRAPFKNRIRESSGRSAVNYGRHSNVHFRKHNSGGRGQADLHFELYYKL